MGWVAQHGLLNPLYYTSQDFLPRGWVALPTVIWIILHKSLIINYNNKCSHYMPKGQSDESNASIKNPTFQVTLTTK